MKRWWPLLALVYVIPAFASDVPQHADPIASVIVGVTTAFFLAIVGRYIARRLNQPGVLGELLMGVLVGNVLYFFGSNLIIILREGSAIFEVVKELIAGTSVSNAVKAVIHNSTYAEQFTQALEGPHGTEYLKIAYVIDIFSRYGVIFLLFMVGLDSSVKELKRTGRESICVAILGVVAPMILGFIVAQLLMPSLSYHADLFIAATLSATSIGITARVLSEMNQLQTREAKTILGAAMIDDVLGLVILAVVSSLVISGAVDVLMVIRIVCSAVLFFVGTIAIGPYVLRKAVHLFRFLEPWESKLFISFVFVMFLAWLATYIQLASIIGAFTAGVILHDGYFVSADSYQKRTLTIKHLLSPLESILAPLFFMVIGIQVKLESFYSWPVIALASGLVAAAIIGKLLSGLGANPKDNRLLIGIGMLPRGEVGLVFASIGRTLGVVSDDLFSAIVLMVMITTFIAPPLLKAQFTKMDGELKA